MRHSFDYTRYLRAKESIDERSFNIRVWEALLRAIRARGDATVHVLEVGAGVGTTFRRFLSHIERQNVVYTMLDIEPGHLAYFEEHLEAWMKDLGFEGAPEHNGFVRAGQRVDVVVKLEDVRRFLTMPENTGGFDVLIAQAFLDLFDIDTFVPALMKLLVSNGLFYFPINFDGVTSFLPIIDDAEDACIEKRYHDSMDEKGASNQASRRSRTGRHLLSVLFNLNAQIISAGGSDWIVMADTHRRYAADEAYFLAQILHFVENELENFEGLEQSTVERWMAKRYAQLEAGELIYMAHQLDVAGQKGV